ncbi:hypothetical protein RP20_CCG002004 [Aedes albopictus]|nr:hypothetical protein RP20_CCG002004 [Aedes albopictus]
MSTPGKYVRAPSISSDDDTDELASAEGISGLYVRACPGPIIEERQSEESRNLDAPDNQLELANKLKELESVIQPVPQLPNREQHSLCERAAGSSSIPVGAKYPDLPDRYSDEYDSEESFVMLFDMATPLARIDVVSASSVPPSVLANRQRCRQLSECSDDSIVFCYESEGNDFISQAEIDFDGEDDSEEDEDTDDDSYDEDSEGTLSHQPDSGFEEKKVSSSRSSCINVE